MSFSPINTQEEFDLAIKERLARERGKYADYDDLKAEVEALRTEKAGFEKAIGGHKTEVDKLNKQLEEAMTKVRNFELKDLRVTAALNAGLPLSLASRISGTDEESINADALALADLFGQNRGSAPLRNTETPVPDEKTAALKAVLKNL